MSEKPRPEAGARSGKSKIKKSEEPVRDVRGARRAVAEATSRRRACPGVRDLMGDYSEQTGANFG